MRLHKKMAPAEAETISKLNILLFFHCLLDRGHLKTLDRIARYFSVSVDYLLGTSPNAELEMLMNEKYARGVTVGSLVQICMEVPQNKREALLTVAESLAGEKERSLSKTSR